MANQTSSNPKVFDTTGTITGNFRLRLLQWVDDNADIPDNANLIFSVNGVTLEATVQRGATANESPDWGAVVWQIGPFSPGIPCSSFSITTHTVGHVHVWM